MEHAKDTNDKCMEWAEAGECSTNPIFIQKTCPESCGFAIAWSPWARRKAKIESLPVSQETNTIILLIRLLVVQLKLIAFLL